MQLTASAGAIGEKALEKLDSRRDNQRGILPVLRCQPSPALRLFCACVIFCIALTRPASQVDCRMMLQNYAGRTAEEIAKYAYGLIHDTGVRNSINDAPHSLQNGVLKCEGK